MAHSRQLRINDISKIRERITEFADKSITVVLHDGRTSTGKLDAVRNDELTLINLRRKEMKFRFNEVAELYFDTLD